MQKINIIATVNGIDRIWLTIETTNPMADGTKYAALAMLDSHVTDAYWDDAQ